MDKDVFRFEISRVFAAMDRKPLTGEALDLVWERVFRLPDKFMTWAGTQLRDMDKLPGNLGLHLERELWPEWRRSGPENTASRRTTCPDCEGRHDLPGSGFYAYAQDGSGSWWRHALPCRCMRLPRHSGLRAWSRAEAERQGYTLIPRDFTGLFAEFDYAIRHNKERRP